MGKKILTVMIGGFIGGSLREFLELFIQVTSFPWVTLAINLSGTFMLSYLTGKLKQASYISEAVFVGITTGVIGSYTTFSTLIFEVNQRMINGQIMVVILYMLLSFGGGIILTKMGVYFGGQKNG